MGTCSELNFYENTIAPNDAGLGIVLDLLNRTGRLQAPGHQQIGTFYTCPSS